MSIQSVEVHRTAGTGTGSDRHAPIRPRPRPSAAPRASIPAPPNPSSDRRAARSKMFPTPDGTARLALLIMLLIAVIDRSEAGTCWTRRFESSGKCSQLFARNVTRESCCGAGAAGGKGFSERDISDVGLFFISAFNDGIECTSCLDTCDRAKCAPNKRCVMRRNRPKCICAPTCNGGRGGANRRRPQNPKRNNRQPRPEPPQPEPEHFHQQNIKVINLSESQRNRRQYFADAGRQPRPRQLRYTGPGADAAKGPGRSVKKSSLSENRSPGSQRASAKHGAKDNDKDKKRNLLESVTLVSNSRAGSSSSSSSSSSSTHNCTAPGFGPSSAGCVPSGRDWTGGERMVLLQTAAGPNGLALNYPTGGKGPAMAKGKGRTVAPTGIPTRRHQNRKDGSGRGNRTVPEQTHRNQSWPKGPKGSQASPAPFVAFGKPKLLQVDKGPGRNGRKPNGTTAARVPRREPQYLDDMFFVESYQHRRDRQHHRPLVEDFWGNEIMQQSSFYNSVCGTDGRTYKTECQLKKRACRQELTSLMVAYKGHCQTSCKFVQCPDGKRCIEDQNASPHCVSCGGVDCRADRSPKSAVCGTDGITYPSICELKRQACLSGRAIPVAYRGRCNEAATCDSIKCKDRQHCLTDLKTHKPRCVSCSYKCPRMKRQQGPGKLYGNAKNTLYNEHNVKLCGTNNRTYHSRCHMQKDSCNTGFYIDVLHSGSCAFGR